MTTVVQALNEVMKAVGHVSKTDRNEHQRFMFRGIDAVMNAVGPALRTHGVVVVPDVQHVEYETVQTTTGKPSTACRVLVRYVFHGPDGDSIAATVAGEAWDSGDKATPKAMSVAYRTALLQALTLPTDEKEPDADVYERAPAQPQHDWRGEADAVPDVDAARALWSRAKAAGADPATLNYITARATALTGPPADTDDAQESDSAPSYARRSTPYGSITKNQIGKIHGLAKDIGIDEDRSAYEALLSEVAKREIASSSELSKTEASDVIEHMTGIKKEQAGDA